jgi:bifunctional DNA-binding transcriptional regulator/antitoxin component of YhaV-PrlF toxin-antitoxin module
MLATSKATKKNQTTLPKAVINALGIKPADRIFYEIEEGKVILHVKTERLVDLKGKFKHFGRKSRYPVSVEQMHEAVMDAVAEKEAGYVKRKKKLAGAKRGNRDRSRYECPGPLDHRRRPGPSSRD